MESIIEYLKRNLKAAGPRRWGAIAAIVSEGLPEDQSIGEPLLRKIAYGDRDNPGVQTVQPLVNYFDAVDRGEFQLPDLAAVPANQLPAITEQATPSGWDGIDRRNPLAKGVPPELERRKTKTAV